MPKTPQATDIVVGAKIRMRRKELGLSQDALAKAVGITFQQVQKYEKGTNRVGASRLQQIAGVLQAPISYFFPDPDAVDRGPEPLHLLGTPGSSDLLRAYATLDPKVRKAVCALTISLAAARHQPGPE